VFVGEVSIVLFNLRNVVGHVGGVDRAS
jgi:hypothetical protein